MKAQKIKKIYFFFEKKKKKMTLDSTTTKNLFSKLIFQISMTLLFRIIILSHSNWNHYQYFINIIFHIF